MAFLNIFSRRKEKKIKESTITVDNRERNSLVSSYLTKNNIAVRFEQLDVADYLVNDVAIERKTISDLKSSIITGRIMRQIKEIKQYPKRLLVLEGLKNEPLYGSGISDNALRGFLLSLALNHEIPIIYTEDAEDTARYLILLINKKSKNLSPLRASKILLTDDERAAYILEGFPGIGPATAKKLLDEFKTVRNIINASEKELTRVIGKKAEAVMKLLTHEF